MGLAEFVPDTPECISSLLEFESIAMPLNRR
jgi:hypothetical protein